jgi:thiosulfate/3-mercaptopyruvate sulfurtransferase
VFTTLIEPLELAKHVDEPQWAVIDCRFELARPEWGERAFAEGHIPHALYAHLEHDLSGPHSPQSGRHPLPEPAALAATFSRFGIDATVQVVAYDQGSSAYAARLWWLARWLGHRAVAVLDGGLTAWQRAGLPLSRTSEARPPRHFHGVAEEEMAVSTAQVAAALAAGELSTGRSLLVDARGAERFAGENETIDPVAGHVPGAHNHPFARNHDAQGRFLPAAELQRAWAATLRDVPPRRMISMCGSGVTACHNLLALEVAGFPGARLYAGSWSEWIRDPARPIARGPEDAG